MLNWSARCLGYDLPRIAKELGPLAVSVAFIVFSIRQITKVLSFTRPAWGLSR